MKNKSGFVALMSAIIISVILLLIVINLSLTGFFARSNILDAELKSRSSALAEACVDKAILNLANNSSYIGGETVTVSGDDVCTINTINPSADPVAIDTKADFENSITNLEVKVNKADLSIYSWREI